MTATYAKYEMATEQERKPRSDARARSPSPVGRLDVVTWLLGSEEDQVLWVLARVASQRPDVVKKAAESLAWHPHQDTSDDHLEKKPSAPLLLTSRSFTAGLPMVQFASPYYYCSESDARISIDVVRIGDRERRSVVNYKTRDISARSGIKYVATSGQIVLEPGEWVKEVLVELIDDDDWDPAQEFMLELEEEGLENAILGRYLHQARVKVVEDDCFPTNRFHGLIEEGQYSKVPQVPALMEYFKMNYQNATVRFRTWMVILIGQLDNLYYFIELLLFVFMVDFVLKSEDSDHLPFTRARTIWAVAGLYVVPDLLLHWTRYWRARLGHVGGNSRKMLQAALLRKYMDYSNKSRIQVREADLVMTATRDTHSLVSDGYKGCLTLLHSCGHLVAVCMFQLLCPRLFGKQVRPMVFTPLFVFPVLMVAFLGWRQPLTTAALALRNKCQNHIVDFFIDVVDNIQLICDFNQRGRAVEGLEDKIVAFNNAKRATNCICLNNTYFPTFLSRVALGIWILVGGMCVVDGTMTIGMFLVQVKSIKGIANSYGVIYRVLLDMELTLPILASLIEFLNLETDVRLRSSLSEHNHSTTRRLIEHGVKFNDLPIALANIDFSYATRSVDGCSERVTRLRGSGLLMVNQGEFTCLIGPKHGGKSTMLRLLGGEILPQPEQASLLEHGVTFKTLVDREVVGSMKTRPCYFVPAHLRVLAVAVDPMFCQGTLMENLVFGVAAGADDPDSSPERVRQICQRLRINEDVLMMLESGSVHRWADVLSQTQRVLLCLARGIIANPDVLCMHKPTQVFDDDQAELVIKMLVDFVKQGGIEQHNLSSRKRGPRTCIITTQNRDALGHADRVYEISPEGVQELDVHTEVPRLSASMSFETERAQAVSDAAQLNSHVRAVSA